MGSEMSRSSRGGGGEGGTMGGDEVKGRQEGDGQQVLSDQW